MNGQGEMSADVNKPPLLEDTVVEVLAIVDEAQGTWVIISMDILIVN